MTPWPASAKHRERSHLGSIGWVERQAAVVTWITWLVVWPYSVFHSGWLWIQNFVWNCKSQSLDVLHGSGMIQVWHWTAPSTWFARWHSYLRIPFSRCPTIVMTGVVISPFRSFRSKSHHCWINLAFGSSLSHFWTQLRESNPQKSINIL